MTVEDGLRLICARGAKIGVVIVVVEINLEAARVAGDVRGRGSEGKGL